jgi:sulfite reductase (NADPH) flavoprotein alpha-component
MSAFAPDRYARAERIIVLAATYGDGDAPASAKGFLDRLATLDHALPRRWPCSASATAAFPAYCAFAKACPRPPGKGLVRASAAGHHRPPVAAGLRALGPRPRAGAGDPLDLAHQPVLPATETLTLISRRDYGAEVQAPTAILRFALPKATLWQRLTRRRLRALHRGRPDRHPARGIARAAPLLARLRAPRRVRRDRGEEAPGGLCSGQLSRWSPATPSPPSCAAIPASSRAEVVRR